MKDNLWDICYIKSIIKYNEAVQFIKNSQQKLKKIALALQDKVLLGTCVWLF